VLVSGLTPNPFAPGSYFNQSLDLETATVTILAGGHSIYDYQLRIDVYVDANLNRLVIDLSSPVSLFTATTTIDTVRPRDAPWHYDIPYICFPGISQPDVFAENLPEEFPPGTIAIYHENDAGADGSTVNQTLTQQGLAHLIPLVPDWWAGRVFGLAVEGSSSSSLHTDAPEALRRVSSQALVSAPAAAVQVRVSALSSLSNDWFRLLAILMATPSSRPRHEAWWSSFWARSFVNVTCSASSSTPPPRSPESAHTPSSDLGAGGGGAWKNAAESSTAGPIAGAVLWLDASSLRVPDGSRLASWEDLSGMGNSVSQATPSLQPTFLLHGGMGGAPTVRFDGVGAFLENISVAIPAQKTIFAVFRDVGSTSDCCSGIVHINGANNGMGTVRVAGAGAGTVAASDDDDSVSTPRIALMIDWAGSCDQGAQNVFNQTLVASVTYSGSASMSHAGGCVQSQQQGATGLAGQGVQIGTRGNELARFFDGFLSEVLVYPRALNASELASVEAYLTAKWPVTPKRCPEAENPCFVLGRQHAITRYVQTIQSRTMWPIKFNGMLFQAATPPYADYRDWGPSNWWQNTRLSYGSMLQTGDADMFETILKYYNNSLAFAAQRTLEYFNHSGIFFTETKHVLGAFVSWVYGCSRPAGWPVWLETCDYIKNDYGGDGGTPEVAMAVLDHYLYTGDTAKLQAYLPIAVQAIEFFMQHYTNRTTDGKIVVWPTQALETFWCAGWDVVNNRPPENCCVDDLPTVAGMHMLATRLLQLPAAFSTPAQRAQWTAFHDVLPALPLSPDGSQLVAARVISSGVHNSETPELYAVHPYRLLTVGRRAVDPSLDLAPAIAAFNANPLAHSNEGWNQGIMNAALLGQTKAAAAMLVERAGTRPAPGYRFEGFMPHFQDYEPSSNHLANYLTALGWMLLQPCDDAAGTMVLLPTWPCDWSVSFRQWGPLNTSVTVDYEGISSSSGRLHSLVVDPPSRRSAVVLGSCLGGVSLSKIRP
jgi:hypothetical protein